MDIVTVLRFVHDHNDKVIGSLVALFLVTSILLLIRSLGEKSEGEASALGAEGVDMKAIEGAMKRVLASQPVSVVASAAPASRFEASSTSRAEDGGVAPAEFEALQAEIAARDEAIAALQKDLEQAKSEDPAAAKGAADSDIHAKLADLQARLAEYEIIEDDIADLTLYRDENNRLKAEVEELRKNLAAASTQAAPAPKIKVDDEKALRFEASDRFELDANDDIMKEFALAVGEQKAPMPESAFSLPEEEVKRVLGDIPKEDDTNRIDLREFASEPKALTPEEEAQAKIDAMFAAAAGDAAPEATEPVKAALSPEEEAQAKIDAMFAAATGDAAPEAKEPVTAALSPEEEAQAKIDAMFATASAETASLEEPSPRVAATLDSAVESELLGVDTAKMLSEVENLGEGPVDESDALLESLDTDKLLAEATGLGGGFQEGPSASHEGASLAEAKPVEPQSETAFEMHAPERPLEKPPEGTQAPVVDPEHLKKAVVEVPPVDDLLAEFGDVESDNH